jgi:hypothetical protein
LKGNGATVALFDLLLNVFQIKNGIETKLLLPLQQHNFIIKHKIIQKHESVFYNFIFYNFNRLYFAFVSAVYYALGCAAHGEKNY